MTVHIFATLPSGNVPASYLDDNFAVGGSYTPSGTGAVPTTVQAKLGESVSVLDFGADPTGVVDSTLGIQAAINSASNIYLPPGTYKITSTLYIQSYAGAKKKLYGAGKDSTVINYQPASVGTSNVGIWCGNYTDNVPTPIYQCVDLVLSDFSLKLGNNTNIGLRVRESWMPSIKRILIQPTTPTGFPSGVGVGMLMDGVLGAVVEQVEINMFGSSATMVNLQIGNSSNLLNTAGSGSGAGATSSVFNTCWFNNAGLAISAVVNSIQFDNCVIEANQTGVQLYAELLADFTNCYFEANVLNCIVVNGLDVHNHSEVRVTGGFFNGNRSGMTSGGAGYSSTDVFMMATYVNRIQISGMQMLSSFVALGSLVNASNCKSVEIDCQPYSMKVARYDRSTTEFPLTNALATTAGTQNITVTMAAHGLPVGATVGLENFTTPINSLPCNLPFYQIISATTNTFTVSPINAPAVNASATGSGLGGTGKVQVYGATVWAHPLITQPEVTKFNDAPVQRLDFSQAFTTPPTSAALLYQGMQYFTTDSWTYILWGVLQHSVIYSNAFSSYAYLVLNYPAGYEQVFQAGSLQGVPALSSIGPINPLGIKVPPYTQIGILFTSASASPSSDSRTECASLYIAPTGYRSVTEV